ncbi:hypothetical protein SAMN04488546_0626 [Geodermatophilus poikilotrophus]|uniref:Uncharacterized protein n=1 Tax=Geodermatophilus poikilotrophus TaxID=1333667 RepID=A0A1H9ZKP3_9ACTN|nr:hypothetical protein SAMN04488546_0626 [Geodermatophilus poikilotrophus]
MPDDVGGDQHVELAAAEPVDHLAPGGRREGTVEDAGAPRPDRLQHRRGGVDGLAGEGDDQRPRPHARGPHRGRQDVEPGQPPVADDLDVGDVGDQRLEHRQRLGGRDHPDLAVLAGEQQTRPGVPAVGVGDPVRLVEDEQPAARRRLLDGAAEDRRHRLDLLLAGGQADGARWQLCRQPGVRLVGQLPQRSRVGAGTGLGEGGQRVVGLAGVRGAEVEHDPLRRGAAHRQRRTRAGGERVLGDGPGVEGGRQDVVLRRVREGRRAERPRRGSVQARGDNSRELARMPGVCDVAPGPQAPAPPTWLPW